MSKGTKVFSNSFLKIIKVLDCMAQPKGTSTKELCRKLKLTRRSISRLLKTIKQDLNIPFEKRREKFGGTASYKIASSFIDALSNTNIPIASLTFNQKIMLHLLINHPEFNIF